MFTNLGNLWNLFRAGEAVSNPKAWQTGQITTTAVAAVLLAIVKLLRGFDYDIPVDDETADHIAVGVIAVANVLCTVISSPHVGLLPQRGANPQSPPTQ